MHSKFTSTVHTCTCELPTGHKNMWGLLCRVLKSVSLLHIILMLLACFFFSIFFSISHFRACSKRKILSRGSCR